MEFGNYRHRQKLILSGQDLIWRFWDGCAGSTVPQGGAFSDRMIPMDRVQDALGSDREQFGGQKHIRRRRKPCNGYLDNFIEVREEYLGN
jgi:hypothetical protein